MSEYSKIDEEIIQLTSLLTGRIIRENLLALMDSEVIRTAFPNLASSDYNSLIWESYISQVFTPDTLKYDFSKGFILGSQVAWDDEAYRKIREMPELASAVSKMVNPLSQFGTEGLQRDLRNYFFAGDMVQVKSLMDILKGKVGNDMLHASLLFLKDFVSKAEKYKQLSVEGIEFICEHFLPYAISMLLPIDKFVEYAYLQIDNLSIDARTNLVDALLLSVSTEDDIGRVEAIIENFSSGAKTLRQGWIAFLRAKDEDAIDVYGKLLEAMRRAYRSESVYFQTISGIFYLFALMRTQKTENIAKAQFCAFSSMNVKFWGSIYQRIYELTCKFNNTKPAYPEEKISIVQNPFCNLLNTLCDIWMEEDENDAMALIDLELKESLADNYAWLRGQFKNIQNISRGISEISGNWLISCMPFRPRWQKVIERFTDIVSDNTQGYETRLAWICVYDENGKDKVLFRPVEQKAIRKGGWSRGKSFQITPTARSANWPEYFTMQDRQMCELIQADMSSPADKDRIWHASLKALMASVGNKAMYWDINGTLVPFSTIEQPPVVNITADANNYIFTLFPEFESESSIKVQKNAHGDLDIYSFAGRTLKFANELMNSLYLPLAEKECLTQVIYLLARNFNIFSSMDLDFTSISKRMLKCVPHVKLTPDGEKMKVEFFLMPFPNVQRYMLPCEDYKEYVTYENGIVIRFVRDFNEERITIDSILQECGITMATVKIGDFSWQLETLEECYDFTLALRKLSDRIKVHWPENHSIRMTRKLDIKDLSIKCAGVAEKSSGIDWMGKLEGEIKLEEGLSLSLTELLVAISRNKGNFIQLSNGQIVALADNFRKRLTDLVAVTNIKDNEVRFNKYSTPFMSLLLDGMLDEEQEIIWRRKAEEIDKAMKLDVPVPTSLNAELRPYQVVGFKWLCQLDAWGAGACLADDMGLGKTIQVISFLLYAAKDGPALIIAPTSLCLNWKGEIDKFAPSLNAIMLIGNKRGEMFDKISAGTVMICSYGILNSELKACMEIDWRVVVLDEAQAIKNHNTKRAQAVIGLPARFRIITTGTPIENRLSELWSLFNFVNPGLLGSRENFKNNFIEPIMEEKNNEALQRLNNITKPFILRRMKTEVLTDLPPKTEIIQHVELFDEERNFYEKYRMSLLNEIKDKLDDKQICTYVIAAITKLRLAACDTRLILPQSTIPSAKLEMFKGMVSDLIAGGHRILVFSQFVKQLTLLREALEDMKFSYLYLDGEMNPFEREIAVNSFQNGESDVFLISLKAGGQGLNLTEADYVIIMDPWWNPAVEGQAADRAYRWGQKRPVTIYRLVTQNTIEDKIIQLHKLKKDLADNILQGTNDVNQISKDELMALLFDR